MAGGGHGACSVATERDAPSSQLIEKKKKKTKKLKRPQRPPQSELAMGLE